MYVYIRMCVYIILCIYEVYAYIDVCFVIKSELLEAYVKPNIVFCTRILIAQSQNCYPFPDLELFP